MCEKCVVTCPHDPRELAGAPIGMYHCPVCGDMVIAGLPHPPSMEVFEQNHEYPQPPEDDNALA